VIPAAAPFIGRAERRAVDRVLKSRLLIQGAEVAQFERRFSQLVGGFTCIAVNSGTSALHLAFLAAGITAGDEVIVPSFSFAATANAVRLAGATPVFGDIDTSTFNLDAAHTESLITSRTRAVMPVHLYGHPANMTTFREITQRHNLLLFEDAAQALGAAWQGEAVGTFGIASSFSFYPTKNITTGEGGLISTQHANLARTARLLRNQGMEQKYHNEIVGFNTRMTDIQAAIGNVQLERLPKWLKIRRRNAEFFSSNLRGVITPSVATGATHAWHQYTIRLPDLDRDRFCTELTRLGVGHGIYYPTPIHRLPSFDLVTDLPNTSQAAQVCVSLPVHPQLRMRDLDKIVDAVNSLAKVGA